MKKAKPYAELRKRNPELVTLIESMTKGGKRPMLGHLHELTANMAADVQRLIEEHGVTTRLSKLR